MPPRPPSIASMKLQALYEISTLLSSSIDLRTNLRGVMRILADYLDMNRGTVALKIDDEVTIVAAHGMTVAEATRGRYKLGEGIIGTVAKHGAPIVIPNVGTEPVFLNKTGSRSTLGKDDIAFICVPIKFKREVLGVLSVDRLFSARGVSFEEDVRLLKIIAAFVAQTVKLQMEFERERAVYRAERDHLRRQLKEKFKVENMIGQSPIMLEVFEAVHRVAPTKASVLLLGESGTGKELVARAVHYMSPRTKGPFIKFNCASIPEGLLESELFGHEKGSFTGATAMRKGRFELAEGGTIFLDEIGDLPLTLQPKILRVLQEREFERVGGERTIKADVRLITATSRNLESLVNEGKFREDLYYRLNVVPIYLPPLRERRDDLPLLVEAFLERSNTENDKHTIMPADMLRVFMDYDWPGNIRELENTIERIVIMARDRTLDTADLPLAMRSRPVVPMRPGQGMKEDLPRTIEEIERDRIVAALTKTGWVLARAARLLGLTSRQIGYKIQKYDIRRPEF